MVVEKYNQTAYVGQPAILLCRPEVHNDVDWNYRATETSAEYRVYSNKVVYKRFRNRTSVNQTEDGDFEMIIYNVSLSDAGRYRCIEDKGLGDIHIVQLTVSGKILFYCHHYLLYADINSKKNHYKWQLY